MVCRQEGGSGVWWSVFLGNRIGDLEKFFSPFTIEKIRLSRSFSYTSEEESSELIGPNDP